jgi:prevent-host-death family protein
VKRRISQRELRNDSAAVLREVQGGSSLIVTRNGTPVAQLTPVEPRRYVPRDVIAETAPRLAPLDAARFRADLDRVADPDADV